ncbi:unnamed protein product [Caenorhabditis sp. 36 PRJEB53466]|nr:unnamed protein product [Caenorhabditis sp. 36 PRJEB53466]
MLASLTTWIRILRISFAVQTIFHVFILPVYFMHYSTLFAVFCALAQLILVLIHYKNVFWPVCAAVVALFELYSFQLWVWIVGANENCWIYTGFVRMELALSVQFGNGPHPEGNATLIKLDVLCSRSSNGYRNFPNLSFLACLLFMIQAFHIYFSDKSDAIQPTNEDSDGYFEEAYGACDCEKKPKI